MNALSLKRFKYLVNRFLSFCALILLLTGLSTVAKAQTIQQLGPNYFVAGIQSNEFNAVAPEFSGRQRQANWCWAACAQMVLNYHGLNVSQEQIVTRIYGALVDQPANDMQVRTALSGWAPNVQGGYSTIYCVQGINSANEITANLNNRWPLIVGLRNPGNNVGHAYVLTAIFFNTDGYNNTIPEKVVLRDPFPGNQSRIEVSWSSFTNRVQSIFKVYVQR